MVVGFVPVVGSVGGLIEPHRVGKRPSPGSRQWKVADDIQRVAPDRDAVRETELARFVQPRQQAIEIGVGDDAETRRQRDRAGPERRPAGPIPPWRGQSNIACGTRERKHGRPRRAHRDADDQQERRQDQNQAPAVERVRDPRPPAPAARWRRYRPPPLQAGEDQEQDQHTPGSSVVAIDERTERPGAHVLRMPETIDEVGMSAGLRRGGDHERDRRPRQRRDHRADAAPREQGPGRPERDAGREHRQPRMDRRARVERQRQHRRRPGGKRGLCDEGEAGGRDEGHDERRQRDQLHGDPRQERDQRAVEDAERSGAGGESGRTQLASAMLAGGQDHRTPEIDAAEQCRRCNEQQHQHVRAPAVRPRRPSPMALRCRSSSCSGSRSSASSNTCSDSDRPG